MRWDRGLLCVEQSDLVASWFRAPVLEQDLSWQLTDTRVLRIRSDGRAVVVKAAGAGNHHIGREITAHEAFTQALIDGDAAARLLFASRSANILALEYLDGHLVEGTADEVAPDVHLQAGRLLRLLHDQESRLDADYESRATARAVAWLDAQHRIDRTVEAAARQRLARYHPGPVDIVPTHGDWQPRNWVIDGRELRVIDFGRFDFRPAATDLCRLAVQQWSDDPALERAFFRGYGPDPRTANLWRMSLLREAIGTAVWAYQVGDEPFEAHGHRMLVDALNRF